MFSDDPHLAVAAPTTAMLNRAQNFYPHQPTLGPLSHMPRRKPVIQQGGLPRRETLETAEEMLLADIQTWERCHDYRERNTRQANRAG